MPRGYRHLQVSFAGGEMSPEMYSRHDDARFRSGAARMRNMLAHPRGSVARRPGFGLVREVKDSGSRVRLLPFRFSTDQTTVIEMGRSTVDSREIGYFRFHTEGATLLQPSIPADHVPSELSAAAITTDDRWQLTQSLTGPTRHGFQTGDPIVFTLHTDGSSLTCAFNITFNRCEPTTTPHNFADGDTVMFEADTALPSPLRTDYYYYIGGTVTSTTFQITDVRGGPAIDLTNAGTGPFRLAVMPRAFINGSAGATQFFTVPNTRYYAIRIDDQFIKIAKSHSDAITGVELEWSDTAVGTTAEGDIRVHFDYRQGDIAYDTVEASPFYLFLRTPWGVPGSRFILFYNHADHDPDDTNYWVRLPGSTSTVTFDNTTNIVTWASGAHGLSDGDPVVFSTSAADLPPEIVAGTVYYVRNGTLVTDEFQIAESVPGPTHEFSDDGTGTHTAFANGFYEVPHFYTEEAMFGVNMAQSGDVLTLVHVDRPVAELKRRGATDWVLEDVTFNAEVDSPLGVLAAGYAGEGVTPDSVDGYGPSIPADFNFSRDPGLTEHEKVALTDIIDAVGGGVLVPDGQYVVDKVAGTSPIIVQLRQFEDGAFVFAPSAVAPAKTSYPTLATTARIRSSPATVDNDETYAVTALDDKSEESAASARVTITNNLLVAGAFNTITWDSVSGATRYRVYKDVNGLLGFMGETDAPTTSFVDDNIAPDLSFTPPILDSDLRFAFITSFDESEDLVIEPDHGLETGAPIIFTTNQTLPPGIETYRTYYVLNPTEDAFQLSETPTGTTPVSMTEFVEVGHHVAITGEWPGAVTYFEQRRVFAGSRTRPQDFWLTASSTESDLSYSIPTLDSDRIKNRLAARERSQIRHAVPAGHLLLLTSAAEYRLTSLDGGSLTPGSVSARAPTQVGVSTASPIIVNNAVLFPADRGGHVRELGFSDTTGDYITGDISLRASHLFEDRTIVQMAYHQAPHPTVWAVSSVGSLLGLTYIPEEALAGWHEHDIEGTVESCTVVSEGDEDRLYIVANRGGTRYIERMGRQCIDALEDVFYVDSGITYAGAPVSSVFIPHLASQAVTFLADGVVGSGTVSASGVLTLSAPVATIHVGLAYESELHTLPLGMQVDTALGSGRTKNVNQVWVRVRKSGAFKVGPDLAVLATSPAPSAGQLLTALVQVTTMGEWDDEGQVYVQQDSPLPLIVAGLTLEVASGG